MFVYLYDIFVCLLFVYNYKLSSTTEEEVEKRVEIYKKDKLKVLLAQQNSNGNNNINNTNNSTYQTNSSEEYPQHDEKDSPHISRNERTANNNNHNYNNTDDSNNNNNPSQTTATDNAREGREQVAEEEGQSIELVEADRLKIFLELNYPQLIFSPKAIVR